MIGLTNSGAEMTWPTLSTASFFSSSLTHIQKMTMFLNDLDSTTFRHEYALGVLVIKCHLRIQVKNRHPPGRLFRPGERGHRRDPTETESIKEKQVPSKSKLEEMGQLLEKHKSSEEITWVVQHP